MTIKKRKCYLCGADLTSKQYNKVTYKGAVRIVCVGVCSKKLSEIYIKEAQANGKAD